MALPRFVEIKLALKFPRFIEVIFHLMSRTNLRFLLVFLVFKLLSHSLKLNIYDRTDRVKLFSSLTLFSSFLKSL